MNREGIKKHKEVFKAWLEGAEIEYRCENREGWEEVDPPGWYISTNYRVKENKFEKAFKAGERVQVNHKCNHRSEEGWVSIVEISAYNSDHFDFRIVREEWVEVDGSELKAGDVYKVGVFEFKCLAIFSHKGDNYEISTCNKISCNKGIHNPEKILDRIKIKREVYEY